MRVVLDTNTVVSAMAFTEGRLAWIRELWSARRFSPLASRETTHELIRVLAYAKFQLNDEGIETLLSSYLAFVEVVQVGSRGPRTIPKCRGPHDDKFLLLGAYGGAHILVTGDRDLLDLHGRVPFTIEKPAAFRRRFPAEHSS